MRVVIDTNLFISSLLVAHSHPGRIVDAWRSGRFSLITSHTQIEEFKKTTRYPKIAQRVTKQHAGAMVNALKEATLFFDDLPALDISTDPYDNFLLAMADAGQADYLVSGDKNGVLAYHPFGRTQIVTARMFCERLGI
jgi:uncharacterized protein